MLIQPNTPLTKYAFSGLLGLILTILLAVNPTDLKAQTDPVQQAALVDLYNATNGASWGNNTGWLAGDASSWYGITVDGGGNVTQINLPSNFMAGTIPASIGDLTGLTTLDLADNALTGAVPVEIGNLISLNYLYLNINQLSGAIPVEIGGLTALLELNLSDNTFSGAIPIELGALTSLQYLGLANNLLTGTLPDELSGIGSGLQYLSVGNNALTGSIPFSYSGLIGLLDVDFSYNNFDFLPDFTASWVSLNSLAVDGNILQFGELEVYESVPTFTYSAQQPFGGAYPLEYFVNISESQTITFSPTGTGLTYQWMKDGIDIGGAVASSYNVPSFTAGDEGVYVLKVFHPTLIDDFIQSQPRTLKQLFETYFTLDRSNAAFGANVASITYAQSWADIDLDGDQDLFIGTVNSGIEGLNNSLFLNDGSGIFTPVDGGDLTTDVTDPRNASWGDINNDGYPDIFVSDLGYRTGAPATTDIKVYINNQDNTFTGITLPAVANLDNTEGGVWGDYDADGFIDLVVWGSVNPSSPLTLFRNNGDNTFSEVADAFNLVLADLATATWIDIDANGTLDLFVSSTAFRAYFRNNGDGTFTQDLTSVLVTTPLTSTRGHSWGDLNNDGLVDLVQVSQASQTSFFINNGGDNFTVVDDITATGFDINARTSSLGDIDNDGDLDLITLSTAINPSIFLNDGAGNFTKLAATEQSMFDFSPFGAVTLSDFTSDGYIDLLTFTNDANSGITENVPRANVNTAASGNNWLEVNLVSGVSNHMGIGSKITLQYANGAQSRYVTTSSGFAAANPSTAHFGIGAETVIDYVHVEWPSGTVDIVNSPAINQLLTVTEGSNPPPPTGLTVATLSESSIYIKWDPFSPSSGALNLYLERATSEAGPYLPAPGYISDTLVNYTDEGLFANTVYYYRIRYDDGLTQSIYSPVVTTATFSTGLPDTWRVLQSFNTPNRLTLLDMAVDSLGNSYLAGNFSGPLSLNGDTITSNGLNDAIVIKVNAAKTVEWIKTFGSPAVDLAVDVAVGPGGTVYVGGYHRDLFTVDGQTADAPAGGVQDGYLAQLSSDGIVNWITTLGSPAEATVNKVAVDAVGDIYLAGYFNGDFTFGASSLAGGGPALFKVAADGTKVFARSGVLNGPTRFVNSFNSVAVGGGNVYVTGEVDGDWSFEGTSITQTGLRDAVLISYAIDGTLNWVKTLGGAGEDFGNEVIVDAAGNVFWAGDFDGATATIDAVNLSNQGSKADIFLAKINGVDGTVLWGKSAGTAGEDDTPVSLATDGSSAFIAGWMGYGTTNFDATSLANGKLFVASYDTDGAVRWVDKSEGSFGLPWGMEYSTLDGGLLMTGSYEYTQRFGATDLTSQGSRNGFLTFHNDSGLPIPAAPDLFKAHAMFDGSVAITWQVVPGVANYSLERSPENGGPFAEIALLADTVAGYSDFAVTSGETYYYRIRSLQGVYSDYSHTEVIYTFSNEVADSWDQVRFYTGKGRENFLDLVTDSEGFTYLVGYTTDSVNVGGVQLTSQGAHDLMAVKLDSLGNTVWAKTFGSTGTDLLQGVQIDGAGGVYLAGYYSGAIDIGAVSLPDPGHLDGVTIKLDAVTGDVIWAVGTGASDATAMISVAVDQDGNVYSGGYFNGTLSHGASTLNGGGHALLKYDPNGVPVYALQGALLSATTEFVNQFDRVKVNSTGVYLLGSYSNDWDFGGQVATGSGGTDFFVAHYDVDGAVQWLRTFAGVGEEGSRDIALDANGDVFVLGYTESAAIQVDTINVNPGSKINLIAKLSGSSGQAFWAKTYGTDGGGSDFPFRIVASPTGFMTTGVMDFEPTSFDGIDVDGGLLYLASFDDAGSVRWVDKAEGEAYSWAMNYSAFHNATVVAGGVHFNVQMGSAQFTGVEERDMFFSMHADSQAPDVPVVTRAVAIDTESVYLEWNPVPNATSYLIQGKLAGALEGFDVRVVPSDTTDIWFDGMLADSTYQFRVVAFGNSVSQQAVSDTVNVVMSCGTTPITAGDYQVSYSGTKRDALVITNESSFASVYELAADSYLVNGLTGGFYKKYFGAAVVIDTLGRNCNNLFKDVLIDPTGEVAKVGSAIVAPDTFVVEYKTVAGDWLKLRFSKTASQIDSADLATIIKLYDTTGGDTWTDKSNWKSGLPVGFWHGIKTSNGRVVEIDLPSNNLIGELPAEIFAMDSLRLLNLGFNQLTGGMPTSITGLTKLEGLYLNDNQISGDIPNDIGLLISLKGIDLGRNKLIGGLPESIGNLVNLESIFGLMGNQLEGEIPASLGNLIKLKIIAFDANSFDGTIPAEIGNLSNLEALYLHQNKLTGAVPDSIANLKNLKSLYLFGNQLSGSLPAGVASMDSLQIMIVQDNEFTFIPNLTGLTKLDTLNISNNKVGFGSIEPNLGVNGFVYKPQGRFGLPLDTLHSAGDAFNFVLEMGGSTNSYQWFKDSVAITGATEQDYFIASTTETDEGTYFARVTNASVPDLTLDTDDYVLKISSRKRDSLALVAIYEGTNGPNWINKANWLQGNLSTWGGITLKNGRVSEINLPNNRITGPMPAAIRDIGNLAVVDFSNSAATFDPAVDNQIRFLPDLKRLDSLTSVNMTRNRLGFVSIEANLASLGDKFTFKPQRRFGETRYDSVPVGQAHKVSIEVSGLTNSYQWYFNDQPIEGATKRFHIIDHVTYDKMGTYFVEVKSPKVPDFAIRNRNQNVLATTTVAGSVSSAFDESPLTAGIATIYQIKDGPYDSIATVQVLETGAFNFEKIVLGDYIVLVKPDLDLFPDALQTYYSSTIDWIQADTLRLRNPVSGLGISYLGTPPPLTGDGVIGGALESDLPDNEIPDEEARILDRKRVSGAGVSLSRQRFRAKGSEFEYDFVAYTVTDEEGNFSFGTLPDDTYLINIQYPGVPMDQSSDILLTLGTQTDFNKISVEALVKPEGIVVKEVESTGVAAPFLQNLNVYPNPGENIINLDYLVRRSVRNIGLKVTDVAGRQLLSQDLPFGRGAQQAVVNISTLHPGMYILVISDEEGSFTETWRIQKK